MSQEWHESFITQMTSQSSMICVMENIAMGMSNDMISMTMIWSSHDAYSFSSYHQAVWHTHCNNPLENIAMSVSNELMIWSSHDAYSYLSFFFLCVCVCVQEYVRVCGREMVTRIIDQWECQMTWRFDQVTMHMSRFDRVMMMYLHKVPYVP